MKKILLILMLLVFLLPIVSAATAEMIPPRPPTQGMGVNQYYAINFDEEGDAEVAAKIQFSSIIDGEIKEVKIEIPGKNIRMITLVQEYYENEKRCNYWNKDQECLEWSEYRSYQPKYSVLDYTVDQLSNSAVYKVKLDKPINMSSESSILLYFKTPSYVNKKFDVFEFEFETAKLDYDTRNVRVAANVNPDLVLKGGASNVNYQPNLFGTMEKAVAMDTGGVQSESLQQFSNQITWAQGYVKETRSLDPLESFTVKGEYAKSWIALHWIGVISGVILLALVILGLKLIWIKKIKKVNSVIAKDIIVGAGSAIAITVLVLLTKYGMEAMRSIVGWRNYELLSIILVLIVGIIVLLLLFGPAIYMGVKYGLLNGVWTISATMIILLFIVIIMVAIFGITSAIGSPVYQTMEMAI